jgi:hypothetical protein
MNSDLVPAIVAAGGGSALMTGIWVYERRKDEAMRASRVRLALRFPAALDSVAAKAALSSLAGLPSDIELVFELAASAGRIGHFLAVPSAVRASVVSTLAGVMPGVRMTEAPAPSGRATVALRIFFPTPIAMTSENPEAAARTLLSGLAALAPGEQVVIRWAVRPSPAPRLHENEPLDRAQREVHRAWRQKTGVSGGFQVAALVLVRAERVARARELAEHVASAIRSRSGAVGAPRLTSERGNRSLTSLPKTTRTSGWLNSSELLPCLGLPLGDDLLPGVEVGASRELLVPRHVSREGRRLFVGRDSLGERPVALSAEAAKHHVLAVGASGTGKSTMLARAVLADIESGASAGAVIDPKADLVATILDRVAPEHAERIVVVDPGDLTRAVPGVAVLAGGDPDLRAEVLTGALRSAFPAEAWGVRTDYFLRLAIRTLAETPEATLADVGRLFFEEPFLGAALARLSDPFLVSAWQSYLSLPAGARFEHVQAPMNRIMALLNRRQIRAIVAAPEPKLDVARLFAEKKWLLISLAPGVLGESGAAVVGSALMYVIWSAIEARVALPPAKRHPIFLYLDELATLTGGTPFSFELLAERARGLGAGLTVAVQTLGRIPEPTRGALLGNVATLLTFRAAAEEAQRLARQLPGLTEADIMSLGRFEVAARIGTGEGSAVAVVTGRTEPLPPVTGQAEAIRDRSAALYGSDPAAAPAPAASPEPTEPEAPVGRQRRRP